MSRDGMIGSARQMRSEPTEAEGVLWDVLRRKGLDGMRFRRQRVFGPYIVDFCCLEHRLVIEVDGNHHYEPDNVAYDEAREQYLRGLGFEVVQFRNDEVLNNLDEVRSRIAAWLSSYPLEKGTGERG